MSDKAYTGCLESPCLSKRRWDIDLVPLGLPRPYAGLTRILPSHLNPPQWQSPTIWQCHCSPRWLDFETPNSRGLWRHNFSPERGSQMVSTLYDSLAVHRNSKPPMQVKKFTIELSIFLFLLCVLGVLKSQRAGDVLHYQCWKVAQRDWGWARNKPQLSGLCRYWINWTCSFIPSVKRLHNLPGQLYSSGALQFNPIPNPLAINPMATRIKTLQWEWSIVLKTDRLMQVTFMDIFYEGEGI